MHIDSVHPSSTHPRLFSSLTHCSSSGLLLYASLVDLLAEDFLSDEANSLMTKRDKISAILWVTFGGKQPL